MLVVRRPASADGQTSEEHARPVIQRPWFVRRAVGWGWRPAAWPGWVVSLVALALVVVAVLALSKSFLKIVAVVVILAAYFGVAALTGSEAPIPASGDDELPVRVLPSARSAVPARVMLREPPPTAPAPGPAGSAPAAPAVPDSAAIPAFVAIPALGAGGPRPPSGEPALVVEHLTKRFGERTAFEDVSFTVASGEVFGFLGPNGAGKTTTVRTLGTLIAPTSGSATVAGIALTAKNGPAIRQRISIMPESPGLYLRLTVAENLELFAGLYGLRHPRPRIAEALEAVNMERRSRDLCRSLSKGLRQRVGLARALLSDPAIMFLDEPTSGLDPVASREVHELIDGLRRRGVTVFLTTHRLEEAERLCDRVAILNTRLRTVGRPEELRTRLFRGALEVETAAPLPTPESVFNGEAGVEEWHSQGAASYVLSVTDPRVAAPKVTRALVAAGADVLSIAEARHSLEDVYLQLVDEDPEARR
ncbi:MAG: ABC transporter ATP-binding protein [Candidatus Dormiibacterota bacterium]